MLEINRFLPGKDLSIFMDVVASSTLCALRIQQSDCTIAKTKEHTFSLGL